MNKNLNQLSESEISTKLSEEALQYIKKVEVKRITGSTNDDVKEYLSSKAQGCLILAEQQESGRGRNNKSWISPFAKNIYMTLGWESNLGLNNLDGLSLVIGTILAESLSEHTHEEVLIKWPNDIYIANKKISGILIETFVDNEKILNLIIGIGINVFMDEEEGKGINQEWTSLEKHTKKRIDRNEIITRLINYLIPALIQFQSEGFKYFKHRFESKNLLKNKRCEVLLEDKKLEVETIGINEKGELIVKKNEKIINLRYGEVSIREL
tara:strand:+ start:42665 stop:43468 length:804 start_codon:yes stop_codon:yes gene_type:complete